MACGKTHCRKTRRAILERFLNWSPSSSPLNICTWRTPPAAGDKASGPSNIIIFAPTRKWRSTRAMPARRTDCSSTGTWRVAIGRGWRAWALLPCMTWTQSLVISVREGCVKNFHRASLILGLIGAGTAVGIWFYQHFANPSEQAAVTHREVATRVLAEYLAAHYPGKAALVMSNPFTQKKGQPKQIYVFEEAGIRGLRKGFSKPAIFRVVFPELRAECY